MGGDGWDFLGHTAFKKMVWWMTPTGWEWLEPYQAV